MNKNNSGSTLQSNIKTFIQVSLWYAEQPLLQEVLLITGNFKLKYCFYLHMLVVEIEGL